MHHATNHRIQLLSHSAMPQHDLAIGGVSVCLPHAGNASKLTSLSHLQSSYKHTIMAIFTTLSLFNPLAVPVPRLSSPFLARQPSPHWKSQIAHSDMHLVFGINFQIHFVSFTSLTSIHLLIHLSTILCHRPSLLHSFTPGSKPTISTNPSHLK